jgi:hypothetical protein
MAISPGALGSVLSDEWLRLLPRVAGGAGAQSSLTVQVFEELICKNQCEKRSP